MLARILEDRALTKTPLGSTALACAAVDDVTAWILLTFVVAVVTAGGGLATLAATLAMTAVFAAGMAFAVRPALRALPRAADPFSRERVAVVVGVLFGAALVTEIIGVHALFGAFVAGACMPSDERYREGLRERSRASARCSCCRSSSRSPGSPPRSGCWTIDRRGSPAPRSSRATIGKLGAGAVTARFTGMTWRHAFALGALMNTAG